MIPILIILAIVIAVGLVCATIAAFRVGGAETKAMTKVNRLTESRWIELWDTSDTTVKRWLKFNRIPEDSHVADQVHALWNGWKGRRLPGIAELHATAARRERINLPARISAGIAKFLLIVGIAGTLLLVHGILNQFKFPVGIEGGQDAARGAEAVEAMFSQLGEAFWPSLFALIGTVLVASAHGAYIFQANKFASALDQFLLRTLLPKFNFEDKEDQLTNVQVKLSTIADSLNKRDEALADASKQLGEMLEELRTATPKFGEDSRKLGEAAANLATAAENLGKSMNQHFGKKSPAVTASAEFKRAAAAASRAVNKLEGLAKKVESTSAQNAAGTEKSAQKIEAAAESIPTALKSGMETASARIAKTGSEIATKVASQLDDVIAQKGLEAAEVISVAASKAAGDTASTITESVKSASDDLGTSVDAINQGIESIKANDAGFRENIESSLQGTIQSIEAHNADLRTNVERSLNEGVERNIAGITDAATTIQHVHEGSARIERSVSRMVERIEKIETDPGFWGRLWNLVTFKKPRSR